MEDTLPTDIDPHSVPSLMTDEDCEDLPQEIIETLGTPQQTVVIGKYPTMTLEQKLVVPFIEK